MFFEEIELFPKCYEKFESENSANFWLGIVIPYCCIVASIWGIMSIYDGASGKYLCYFFTCFVASAMHSFLYYIQKGNIAFCILLVLLYCGSYCYGVGETLLFVWWGQIIGREVYKIKWVIDQQ